MKNNTKLSDELEDLKRRAHELCMRLPSHLVIRVPITPPKAPGYADR